MIAYAAGDLDATWHLYPPLYDLFTTPFFLLWPEHPHFIPDALLLAFYCYVLLTVCRRFYGPFTAPLVTTVLMIGLPLLTMRQWVIPWTTSLQSALVSLLFLIYFRFEREQHAFVLNGRRDYAWLCSFFLAYGALLPTRPLDIVIFLPFAVAFFIRVNVATARFYPAEQRMRAAAAGILLPALCGSVFVAFYLGFNAVVFRSMLGRYIDAVGQFRYDVFSIPTKAYSIFWQSSVEYGEAGQAFFEKVPLLAPALALCVITAFACRDIRRWIVICAFLQFVAYLPYGDLLPTGVFRYYNLHYFKWTYIWLFVIAVGQLLAWSGRFRQSDGWKPLAAAVVVILLGANVSLVPTNMEIVTDQRFESQGRIAIDLAREREVNYIDIPAVRGAFPNIYFGGHTATIDGTREFNRREFRILPMADGVRLLFSRPERLKTISLKFDTGIAIENVVGEDSVAATRFAFACRLYDCK